MLGIEWTTYKWSVLARKRLTGGTGIVATELIVPIADDGPQRAVAETTPSNGERRFTEPVSNAPGLWPNNLSRKLLGLRELLQETWRI
jgi:hypothetical protein